MGDGTEQNSPGCSSLEEEATSQGSPSAVLFWHVGTPTFGDSPYHVTRIQMYLPLSLSLRLLTWYFFFKCIYLFLAARGPRCPQGHSGILVPRPGIEPEPPALEGEVLTTGQPGKSLLIRFLKKSFRLCSDLAMGTSFHWWWLRLPGNHHMHLGIPVERKTYPSNRWST